MSAIDKQKSKHTPGPWTTYLDHRNKHWPGIEASSPEINQSVVIFGVRGMDESGVRGRNWDEAQANARLIAAAPELLEALKEIVNFWDSLVPASCVNDMHTKARAAIAKATGEQQ